MDGGERIVKSLMFLCAALAILMLSSIAIFVFWEGIFGFQPLDPLGTVFYVGRELYGLLPLLVSSLLIVGASLFFAVILALPATIFITEVAPSEVREILKSLIELLSAIPSVIYGFIGLVFLAPIIADLLSIPSGTIILTASLLLAIMVFPTIVSLSSEALLSIPEKYREASYALGASEWETIRHVVLPASKNGIFASIILAFGRAIGETIAVLLVAGTNGILPSFPWYNQPGYPITAAIARTMGAVPMGGKTYQVLFSLGVVLFIITFITNTLSDHIRRSFSKRFKER